MFHFTGMDSDKYARLLAVALQADMKGKGEWETSATKACMEIIRDQFMQGGVTQKEVIAATGVAMAAVMGKVVTSVVSVDLRCTECSGLISELFRGQPVCKSCSGFSG